MPRCFCVMVYDQVYVPGLGKTFHKFENYRVLVGPKANLDSLKATFDEKVKGSFEIQLRE